MIDNPVLHTPSPKKRILEQTLAEILTNNTQAQNIVMKAMRITPEKFQEMLAQTSSNTLMQTPIRDLFRRGIVRKAVEQKDVNQQVVNQGISQNGASTPEDSQKI